MRKYLKSPWPFGLGWLWKMFLVFGVIDPPEVPDPTPLEIASKMFVQTQRDLLLAENLAEEAQANVTVLTGRVARLRADIANLSKQP
jgi:hypothetical protein